MYNFCKCAWLQIYACTNSTPSVPPTLTPTHPQLLSSHRSSQALSTPTPSQPSQNHHHHHPPTTPSGPTSSNWTPSTGGSRKRGRGTSDTSATMATGGSGEGVESLKRRRSAAYKQSSGADKQQNKGLRHFSQRVCEKVRQKGTTTYNEVGGAGWGGGRVL